MLVKGRHDSGLSWRLTTLKKAAGSASTASTSATAAGGWGGDTRVAGGAAAAAAAGTSEAAATRIMGTIPPTAPALGLTAVSSRGLRKRSSTTLLDYPFLLPDQLRCESRRAVRPFASSCCLAPKSLSFSLPLPLEAPRRLRVSVPHENDKNRHLI